MCHSKIHFSKPASKLQTPQEELHSTKLSETTSSNGNMAKELDAWEQQDDQTSSEESRESISVNIWSSNTDWVWPGSSQVIKVGGRTEKMQRGTQKRSPTKELRADEEG